MYWEPRLAFTWMPRRMRSIMSRFTFGNICFGGEGGRHIVTTSSVLHDHAQPGEEIRGYTCGKLGGGEFKVLYGCMTV